MAINRNISERIDAQKLGVASPLLSKDASTTQRLQLNGDYTALCVRRFFLQNNYAPVIEIHFSLVWVEKASFCQSHFSANIIRRAAPENRKTVPKPYRQALDPVIASHFQDWARCLACRMMIGCPG
ncbi:hypothetical protein [Brucella pseudogrignonensis]|uniref:hypothetical protein n=1 Tax=Brucella pseudogrignonensis TaxID=419475 RepID=UPI003D9976B9